MVVDGVFDWDCGGVGDLGCFWWFVWFVFVVGVCFWLVWKDVLMDSWILFLEGFVIVL